MEALPDFSVWSASSLAWMMRREPGDISSHLPANDRLSGIRFDEAVMNTENDELSEAIVLYTGWRQRPAPMVDESKVVDRFGLPGAPALLEKIRAIFEVVGAMPVDWSVHTLASAGEVVRSHVRAKYPCLSEDALRAVAWKFTFDWR